MHVVPESPPAERCLREGKIGRLMNRLDADNWRVLDEVHTGLHTIDHVVVGPPGIFTVRTNPKRGVERAVETDRFWLSHASSLGRWVEHAVATPVQPLLVFSQALVVPSVSWQLGAWV